MIEIMTDRAVDRVMLSRDAQRSAVRKGCNKWSKPITS